MHAMAEESGSSSSNSNAIDSSNIGFKLLQKHGWKEGTGLGVSEQGRLEPLEAHLKNNKRGLGAPTLRTKLSLNKNKNKPASDEEQIRKPLSKKQKKLQEMEKRLQEKEFERAFFREFWPDNV